MSPYVSEVSKTFSGGGLIVEISLPDMGKKE